MPTRDVQPAGEPLGFPRCPACAYVRQGPAYICTGCASKTIEAIAHRSCEICSQALDDDGSCRNWLCNDPGRRITSIAAIAYLSGDLQKVIHRYKYDGKTGWALVFGRLLSGWLADHAHASWPDLVIANPTYVEPGSDAIGHVEQIIRAAAAEDVMEIWPFDLEDPAAIIKTGPTDKSAGGTMSEKAAAGKRLARLLNVPDPERTAGRSILVFDDVCTTGSQLNAVAGCLLDEGGAAEVHGLVLARAAWRPR
jgi:predicted amidophosphoribosyltransferase